MGYGDMNGNKTGNGFENNPQNINKNGSKPSIKRQLEKILDADGRMKIRRKDVVEINDDFILVKVPEQQAVAMKLINWAMSNKHNASIKAIQMILEHFDGKPNQPISGADGGPIEVAQKAVFVPLGKTLKSLEK